MRRILSILAVLTVGLFTASAHASTFILDFHTGTYDYSGELVLTGTLLSPGVYYITTATGNINGSPISLETPSSGAPGDVFIDSSTGYSYDNLFYSSGDPFDSNGLFLDGIGVDYNVYGYSLEAFIGGSSGGAQNVVYDSITQYTPAVPEPSSFLLLGTGSVAMISAVRRRFRTV